jgi:hypothetical protein
MTMSTIAEELNALLAQLPPSEQARVLNFARTPLPPGSSPDALLRIRVDPEVGEAMEQALADCERIDPDE